MLEYAISFYETYTVLFYLLLVVAVILEGPITVLAISLFAPKFGFYYYDVLLFAFIGDFGGDMLHFFLGKFFSPLHRKIEKSEKLQGMIKKIDSYSFFDKLLIIKYTPPITSIGLIYLGASKIRLKDFLLKDAILCFISSLILSGLGYNFGQMFPSQNSFWLVFAGIGITFAFFYFGSKYVFNIITKHINKKNNLKK